MYSDLLDVLGNQNSTTGGARRGETEKHVAVSFKAGKMKMELREVGVVTFSIIIFRGRFNLVIFYTIFRMENTGSHQTHGEAKFS